MEKEKTESSESSTATSLNSDEKSSSDGQAEEKSERITLKPSAPVQKKLMARFVKDITMPDGSEIAPCSTFFKTWKVRNDGEYDWPEGCVLVSAGGDCMIDPKLGQDFEIRQEVPATPAGGEVELKVELCAPSATGRHVSYFRLQNPEGSFFGQRLWADIRVNEADMSVSMTLAPWEIIEEDDDEEVEVKQPTGKETVEEIMEEEKNPDVLTADEREKILEDTPVVDETTSTSSSQELTESQQLDNEFDEDVRRWSHELRTLASMGFNDLEQLLPVLKAHIKTPSSECDSPKPEGLQAVVLALLSQE
jgi:next-to-BRCA1 protein 1